MRTISANLTTAQQRNSRFPISRAEIYDTMLRWTQINAAFENTGYPDVLGTDSVSQAPMDSEIYSDVGKTCWVSSDTLYWVRTTDFTDWDPTTNGSYAVNALARPSIFAGVIYVPSNSQLLKDNVSLRAIESTIYAVAAVAADNVYAISLDSNEIKIYYYTAAAVASMVHSIPVDDEYNTESLTWFDAVRLSDDTDVVVFNVETYGCPRVLLRRNGVWGTPAPMIPIDIVDNYSYLRIGWLTVTDGVIYATGELGRKGSTGLHAQSMSVVLRSKDGIHWTLDRYRYLGATPMRSPLLMDSGYAYWIKDGTVYEAPLTPVFGLDDGDITADHIHFLVEDEINGWRKEDANHGMAGSLNISLADQLRMFTSSSGASVIEPGYILDLYAGYRDTAGDNEVLLNRFGIDSVSKGIAVPGRSLSLGCREWAYRNLKDGIFDQDWQWLSQTKNYDDCDNVNGLYAIGGGYIRVEGEGELTSVQTSDVAIEDSVVKVVTANRRTALISEEPFSADDAQVSVCFTSPAAVGAYDGLAMVGLGYSLSDKRMGCGAGPAMIKDQYNFMTAFLDVVTEQLILISVAGSESSDEIWTEVATNDISSIFVDGDYNQVWMSVVGTHVVYGVDRFSSGSAGIQASLDYTGTVVRNDENRTGVIAASSIPNMSVITRDSQKYSAWIYFARHLAEFNDGDSIAGDSSYAESSDYLWANFYDQENIEVDDEYVTITNVSDVGSFCTGLWTIVAAEVTGGTRLKITVDKTCFPPAGAWTYWQSFLEKSAIHFVTGERAGDIGIAWTNATEDDVNIWFEVLVGEDLTVPAVGDNIVIGPAWQVSRSSSMDAHADGVTVYPAGYEDMSINLASFTSFDMEADKSIDWLLKDIASKAGILDFAGPTASDPSDTAWSIDDTLVGGGDWLDDQLHSFFLQIEDGTDFTGTMDLYLGMSTKVTDASNSGLKVAITFGATTTIGFYHTGDTASWTKLFEIEINTTGGQKLTVTKTGRYVSLWLEEKLLASCAYYSMFGLTADNYSSTTEDLGYFGINYAEDLTVKQKELYSIADGIIADQGMQASGVMNRAIRDARIKLLPTTTGGLHISSFTDRDDLGTIPDVIFGDSDDSTDRIPTHIRTVGAEIGEYIDHTRAAQFGILFHTARAESLDEEAAYTEAQRIVLDALSYSESNRPVLGSQLEYEVEDKLTITLTTIDEELIDEEYVVDGISTTFSGATLEATASLRKLYD